MGVDYYKILQLDRKATIDDIKKAYLKLGLEEFDDSKFKILSDAFDVLSDPRKRAVYDRDEGEEGSKGQVPPRGAGSDGSNMNMSNHHSPCDILQDRNNHRRGVGSDGPNMYRSNRHSPYDVFQDRSNRRRGARSDVPNMYRSNRRSYYDIFQDRSNFPSPYETFHEFFGPSGSSGETRDRGVPFWSMPTRKGAAIERTLPCSLEDLYNGATKKMKITSNVTDANKRPATMSEILTIKIMPGWKKGTKITFAEKGNKQHGVIPSDIVFIIDEKPHSIFKRIGDDLIATLKISLTEASTGYTAQLTTLDGRSLTILFSSGISPIYEKVIEGEGMPFSKEPSKKGNLIIKFDIE